MFLDFPDFDLRLDYRRRLGGVLGTFFTTRSNSSSSFPSSEFDMTGLFADPKRRLTRAQEHIVDLEAGIRDFLHTNPYSRIIEIDPNTGNKTHKVKLTRPIPDQLLSQTVEISEGLRSCLDKCGFVAAMASGNKRLKGTYFPIADTEEKLDADVIGRGRCRDLPDDIVNLFRSFQPYKAGNPLIWSVNQLANGTKHRILVPVGIDVGNAFMRSYVNKGLTVEMGFPPKWDWENDEMILCVVGPNPEDEPSYDMSIQMLIEVKPIDGIRLGEAASAFRTIASEVERVVVATEAETERLGLI